MKKLQSAILLGLVLLSACTGVPQTAVTPTTETTATLPEAQVYTTPTPDAQSAAKAFLDAWSAENYAAMYDQLTTLSRDAISADDFSAELKDVAATMSLKEVKFELLQSYVKNTKEAQVAYRATYTTVLVGDVARETTMNLTLQDGIWKIQWEDGMILPELRGGNHLAMDITVPTRGNIYDINGNALAAQTDAIALGIIPGQIEDGREGQLLTELSNLTGLNSDYIQSLYEYAGADWYIPVADVPAAAVEERLDVLSSLGGLTLSRYNTRYYFDSAAPHVVGYVQPIYAENLEEYRRKGYKADEMVGAAGIELWAENYLSGQRGAALYVVDSQGVRTTRLGQSSAGPAYSVYTTFDMDFQEQVERAIDGFRGAAVVIEVNTGRVLAMASSPSFNPNLFDANNYNSNLGLQELYASTEQPLLNRATQGTYPLGSVFKIITMATALETGAFDTTQTYECGYTFTDLPGITLYDWTYEKDYPPSGTLNLPEALMRSCNIWFYHIGVSMYDQGYTEDVSKMARAFGLGSKTGIEVLDEAAGNMPNPTSDLDAAQLAIGQGEMLVTPLQVARFIAAIANGGTLYRPQVVEKITDTDNKSIYSFKPEAQGTLPISAETLKTVQEAMYSVVNNTRGTAQFQMVGLQTPIYGKTGTASNATGTSHAWFAGYTAAGREDRPDIAIAVIAENAGEGSDIAAPIFRRIVEIYFSGRPNRLYPWESSYYVTRTPTPEITDTPEPYVSPTPEG
jgi:penicillin-binding protein 2